MAPAADVLAQDARGPNDVDEVMKRVKSAAKVRGIEPTAELVLEKALVLRKDLQFKLAQDEVEPVVEPLADELLHQDVPRGWDKVSGKSPCRGFDSLYASEPSTRRFCAD